MHGLVSIIMPSYNTAAYIANSIQSILAQTYTNWELIIVDPSGKWVDWGWIRGWGLHTPGSRRPEQASRSRPAKDYAAFS